MFTTCFQFLSVLPLYHSKKTVDFLSDLFNACLKTYLCIIIENRVQTGEKNVRPIKRHLGILRCVHLHIAALEGSWVDVAAVVGI